jgi:hypothetical protein
MNILPLDRQTAVVSALVEGNSIRSTERLTETHRDTIMRLGVRIGLGRGCAALHDLMFRRFVIKLLLALKFAGVSETRSYILALNVVS